jgi:hypothetical protein
MNGISSQAIPAQRWHQGIPNHYLIQGATVNDENQHKPPTTISTSEQEIGWHATEY